MARRRKTLPIRIAPEQKREIPSEKEALGRNLAAAFIATCQGIGKYTGQPVGEYWITLARMVIADQSKSPAETERTPTIQ